MKISPYTSYLELQPNALLVRQNCIICKKWVLHWSNLRSNALVRSCVKVQAAELLEHISFVYLHFLRSIVQLVALHKTITASHSAEAHYCPKVLRQVGKSIRGRLVELHLKFDQNVSKDRLRRHPGPSYKKTLQTQ
jgi:hypothetical protein